MKGKGTMVITMGATIALLICVMTMQFKTIDNTDIDALETMTETELRTELASWKTKYEEAVEKLNETNSKIAEYNKTIENNQEASELLHNELENANMILGKTDVRGDGIIITLEDIEYSKIDASDLYKLVNELRLAGAEAISINGMRIISMTDIKNIADGLIMIGGERYTSPYIVKAIGDQVYLESGLTLKYYGYMDLVIKSNNKYATLVRQNNILIEKYNKEFNLKYSQEVVQ